VVETLSAEKKERPSTGSSNIPIHESGGTPKHSPSGISKLEPRDSSNMEMTSSRKTIPSNLRAQRCQLILEWKLPGYFAEELW